MSTRTLRRSRNTSRYRILRMGRRMSRKLGALVSFVLSFAFVTTAQTQASARAALDGSARGAAITCITAYQNHLSPYKGFSCAYRVAYGGESCSAYVKRTVAEQGVGAAMGLAQQRFALCRLAAQELRASCSGNKRESSRTADSQRNRRSCGRSNSCNPVDVIDSACNGVDCCSYWGPRIFRATKGVSGPEASCADAGCVDAGCAHCGVSDVACLGCL
jgi:putative component of membrane protein insertase Oxa1/YidC/SpoIIIJ protein YidD